MHLTQPSLSELEWWLNRDINHGNPVRIPLPSVVIKSDSSQKGWGCVCETTHVTSQGLWSSAEKDKHINYLELKAAKIALVTLASPVQGHSCAYLSRQRVCCSIYTRIRGVTLLRLQLPG